MKLLTEVDFRGRGGGAQGAGVVDVVVAVRGDAVEGKLAVGEGIGATDCRATRMSRVPTVPHANDNPVDLVGLGLARGLIWKHVPGWQTNRSTFEVTK